MAAEQTSSIEEKNAPETFIKSTMTIPCLVGDTAYVPYWTKENGEIVYGIDECVVNGLCGCGDFWLCHVTYKNGFVENEFEPGIDVFFTQKDAEKKLSGIKRNGDLKKITRHKRRI